MIISFAIFPALIFVFSYYRYKQLLKIITQLIDEGENETLVELAKILGNFIDCIGGINYIKELFNILEAILIVDDPNIQKETINSLKKQ